MRKLISQINNLPSAITIEIPSDKSISHRALILLSIACGKGKISNILRSEDVLATLNILRELGVQIETIENQVIVHGCSSHFTEPLVPLDCGNSGTSIRLLLGLCAAHPISCTFIGDESLSKRPMGRVTRLLQSLGVEYDGQSELCPIAQTGSSAIAPFDLRIPLPSAQVKSSLMLVALQSNGGWIRGGGLSRDHTEKLISSMGGEVIQAENGDVYVGASTLQSIDIHVPADFSSAAFFIAAGLLIPKTTLRLLNVCLNPTRTGLLTVLSRMGANIHIENRAVVSGEAVGDIVVQHSRLRGVIVPESLVPTMIDEFPVLSILASQAQGTTIVSGAEDLRKKESDRIHTTCALLRTLGGTIEERPDGWKISGPQPLRGGVVHPSLDHRIAMAAAIAGCVTSGGVEIAEPTVVDTSFPTFWQQLSDICQVDEIAKRN